MWSSILATATLINFNLGKRQRIFVGKKLNVVDKYFVTPAKLTEM